MTAPSFGAASGSRRVAPPHPGPTHCECGDEGSAEVSGHSPETNHEPLSEVQTSPGAIGLTAFVRYTSGALTDAGLAPDMSATVANEIVSGTHVNDLAAEPWMPPDVADLIAGSREVLHVGQSVAYWGAAIAAGVMCLIGAALMFVYVRKVGRRAGDLQATSDT